MASANAQNSIGQCRRTMQMDSLKFESKAFCEGCAVPYGWEEKTKAVPYGSSEAFSWSQLLCHHARNVVLGVSAWLSDVSSCIKYHYRCVCTFVRFTLNHPLPSTTYKSIPSSTLIHPNNISSPWHPKVHRRLAPLLSLTFPPRPPSSLLSDSEYTKLQSNSKKLPPTSPETDSSRSFTTASWV